MTASKNVYDVIVVGAGLSGLQAAQVIQAAGFTVCVLEATNRVGGKTLTVKSSEKGYNDLGAAWINDSTQIHISKLHRELGLTGLTQRAEGTVVAQDFDGTTVEFEFGEAPKVSWLNSVIEVEGLNSLCVAVRLRFRLATVYCVAGCSPRHYHERTRTSSIDTTTRRARSDVLRGIS